MSNNNFFDEDKRKKFLQNADMNTLNDYFINLEKLSKRKGGKFTEIYNNDIYYVANEMEIKEDDAFISNLFIKSNNEDVDSDDIKKNNKQNKITETESIANTETYISRIKNITRDYSLIETERDTTNRQIKDPLKKQDDVKQIKKPINNTTNMSFSNIGTMNNQNKQANKFDKMTTIEKTKLIFDKSK